MNILQAILLGLIQGLTEFLPVSSSAHLTLAQYLLGLPPDIPFDIVVHLATLLAVVIYFWPDILQLVQGFFLWLVQIVARDKKGLKANLAGHFAWLIIVATIPTGLMGWFFKDFFEGLFSSLFAVGGFLILTGLLLFFVEKIKHGDKKAGEVTITDALVIGLAQGCAIAPGLSRSGTTVAASLYQGLGRELAARFSFLLSIPAILGAFLLQIKDLGQPGGAGGPALLLGFLSALVSGYFAIKVFMAVIKRRSLRGFAYYCFALGLLVVIVSLFWVGF